jgi:hypothetical protein
MGPLLGMVVTCREEPHGDPFIKTLFRELSSPLPHSSHILRFMLGSPKSSFQALLLKEPKPRQGPEERKRLKQMKGSCTRRSQARPYSLRDLGQEE